MVGENIKIKTTLLQDHREDRLTLSLDMDMDKDVAEKLIFTFMGIYKVDKSSMTDHERAEAAIKAATLLVAKVITERLPSAIASKI